MVPLVEMSSPEATALLERYAAKPEALGLASAVEKAHFQQLLWAFFEGQLDSWKYVDPEDKRQQRRLLTPKQKKPERALHTAASLIRRLALSKEEILALPDTLARTLESRKYPPEFNPDKPEEPFLPADLYKTDGPWVALGNSTELPLAIRHVTYFGGRSSFQIFLRVPAGRGAAQELIFSLSTYRGEKQYDPPRIPAGTQLALVEQSFLINAAGDIVPSPLVEIVELRVIRNPSVRAIMKNRDTAHAVFRFRLRPDLLATGDPAPLRARGTGEEDWEPIVQLVEQGRAGPWDTGSSSLFLCSTCHSFSQAQALGIFEFRQTFKDAGTLGIVDPAQERKRILQWKLNDAAWKELLDSWK